MARGCSLAGVLAFSCLAGTAVGQPGVLTPEPVRQPAPEPHAGPVIQLAICLDTSGSMGGLIHQARSRLWAIVNDLTLARHGGEPPRLEVAVYQYGSNLHPSGEHFMSCVLPFTSDLDAVSEALFSLSVGGSAEYCGAVVESAAQHLSWTAAGPGSLRTMIVAGNEAFTQGPVSYKEAVPEAVERGIYVNTIYCGRDEEGQATGWLHAAHLAGGDYAVIDHDRDLVRIPCPQDERIGELNALLNETYLAYGAQGRANVERQASQDRAAASVGELSARAGAKVNRYAYHNRSWDLVDLYDAEGAEGLAGLAEESLPERMRSLDDGELVAQVQTLHAEREAIRGELAALVKEREAWLRAEVARLGDTEGPTLDDAVTASIRRQAAAVGFTYADEQ